MDVIDIIVELLKTKGVTGAQMSRDLGFSNAVFSQWKQKKQKPSAVSLQKMAEYFSVSVDYLLGHETVKEIIPGRLKIIETNDPESSDMKYTIEATDKEAYEFGLKIFQDAGALPEDARQEILDYVDFIKNKKGGTPDK